MLVDGELALFVERGGRKILSFPEVEDEGALVAAVEALRKVSEGSRSRILRVERIDDEPARSSPLAAVFAKAGFKPDYRGLTYSLR